MEKITKESWPKKERFSFSKFLHRVGRRLRDLRGGNNLYWTSSGDDVFPDYRPEEEKFKHDSGTPSV